MAGRKGSDDKEPRGKGRNAPAGPKPPRPFDVWLDRGLHSLFDGVTNEPIPEELLRLIKEDRKK